jgi:hypothetical protein
LCLGFWVLFPVCSACWQVCLDKNCPQGPYVFFIHSINVKSIQWLSWGRDGMVLSESWELDPWQKQLQGDHQRIVGNKTGMCLLELGCSQRPGLQKQDKPGTWYRDVCSELDESQMDLILGHPATCMWCLGVSKSSKRPVLPDMPSAWNVLPSFVTWWTHEFFKTQLSCPLSFGA